MYFVVKPLFSLQGRQILHESAQEEFDELELRQVILMRDALFQRLIFNSIGSETLPHLSDDEALSQLVSLCKRLDSMGLAWKPRNTPIKKEIMPNLTQQDGCASVQLLSLSVIVFCFALIAFMPLNVFSLQSFSQTEQGHVASAKAPADVIIPPPTVLPQTGFWLPSVNQYILIPEHGKLSVYYVGMFQNNTTLTNSKVQIPLPKNFQDLKIIGNQNLKIEKSLQTQSLVVGMALTHGLNQISATFSLDAPYGIAKWLPADLQQLPGVTIIMMPEYEGGLRHFFTKFLENPNVWPPRMTEYPSGFRSILGVDPLDNQTPLNQQTSFQQLSRQLVRVGDVSSPFPVFEVQGIVPSRIGIYILVIFFAFFLLGTSLFFKFKMSK
jgi:hypothetical protein